MNREQLAHVLRAASGIVDDPDILVIGSQSLLASYDEDELPLAATTSMEVVVFPVAATGDAGGAYYEARRSSARRAKGSPMITSMYNASVAAQEKPSPIHILWINAGLSCDGESVSLTAATQPSIEEIALGALPGLPEIALHWPFIDFECGPDQGADTFIEWFHKAGRGELGRFVLVVEGSIPDESLSKKGYFTGFGYHHDTGQPITVNEWLDQLAPEATIVLAVGSCAAYGGIHGMAGNPTGAMGVPDYLGWDWTSKAGIPIVCVPGCPANPDNLSETLLYLLYQIVGQAPMIPLDEQLRPQWLFGSTVHESCNRAGYYEQGEFAQTYDSSRCLAKLGCAGQVVKCNVPKRGWINGVGGCPNVGGICIGCTMPSFPDKFMPFMDQLPITWRSVSTPYPGSPMSAAESESYGAVIRQLREFALKKFDTEPSWRRRATPEVDPDRPRFAYETLTAWRDRLTGA